MSSWHEDTCRRADVHIIDGLPFCMRCASNASIEDATAATAGPAISLPPPPPRWDMNLRWPRSVQYQSTCRNDAGGQIEALLRRQDETGPQAIQNQPINQLIPARTSADAPSETSDVTMSWEDAAPSESTWQAVSISDLSLYDTLGEDDHIRLFTLSKGRGADPLHGRLAVASLKTRPLFEAVSYTWADDSGDVSKRKKVFVGDRWDAHLITANCQAALARFRSPDEDRVLWIDQICIDQGREYERTHHVGLIRDIYATAASVLVYLGPDDTGAGALALDSISQAQDDREIDGASRAALRALFARPYFSRVWVIQELAMARAATVHCGRAKLGWSLFNEERLRRLGMLGSAPEWILEFRSPRYRGVDELVPLLVSTVAARAMDPRDKIFALLGLMQDASLEGIIPDYSRPVPEILVGAAAFALAQQGRYDILSYACGGRGAAQGLPSWVPDWSDNSPADEGMRLVARQRLTAKFGKHFEQLAAQAIYERPGQRFDRAAEEDRFVQRYELTPLAPSVFAGPGLVVPSIHGATGALVLSGVNLGKLDTERLDPTAGSRFHYGTLVRSAKFDVIVSHEYGIDKNNNYLFLLEGADACFHLREQAIEGVYTVMGVCHVAALERTTSSIFSSAAGAISDLVPFTPRHLRRLIALENHLKDAYGNESLIDDTPNSLLYETSADYIAPPPSVVEEAYKAFLKEPVTEIHMEVDGQTPEDHQPLATAITNRLAFWHRDSSWELVRQARSIKDAIDECTAIEGQLSTSLKDKSARLAQHGPRNETNLLASPSRPRVAESTDAKAPPAPHIQAHNLRQAAGKVLRQATEHGANRGISIEFRGETLGLSEAALDRFFDVWIEELKGWSADADGSGNNAPQFTWGPFDHSFGAQDDSLQHDFYTRRLLMQLRPETRQTTVITII